MAFLSRSRLFGILLIVASLPMDPGVALATGMATVDSPSGEPPTGSVEARLRRIAQAVREQGEQPATSAVGDDALALVVVGRPGLGWINGGGFRNGGFYNGGFRNGGFYNGGFRNGGFGNGGFRNGGFANW